MRSISVPDPRATGRYSDGVTAAQRAVTLSVEGDGLILATDTGPLTRWPCAAVRLRDGAQQTARAGVAVLIHEAEQVRLTALTDLDRKYLKFAEAFERQFITQGDEDRPIERTLSIAWDLFGTLPEDELKRIRKEYLAKYHPAARAAAEKAPGS